jgi:hypothetical protein
VLARRQTALLALLLAAGCAGQERVDVGLEGADVRIRSVERHLLLDRLAAVPQDDADRGLLIERMFRKVGCGENLERRPVVGAKLPNLVCTLHGRTPARIVVGASYDRPRGGRGIVDDWSGAAMLPSLFTAMLAERRHHTFEFVAFYDAVGWREPTARKTWNLGSEFYVDQLDAGERARMRAMVGLVALGLGPLSAWAAHADPALWLDFAAATRAVGLPLRDVSFKETRPGYEFGIPSDAEPFRTWGLPSITLHSYDQDTLVVLRDPTHDKSLSRIDPDRYAESFRLISVYLAYLDQSLAARAAAPAPATP